jgi:hypothetical protein
VGQGVGYALGDSTPDLGVAHSATASGWDPGGAAAAAAASGGRVVVLVVDLVSGKMPEAVLVRVKGLGKAVKSRGLRG